MVTAPKDRYREVAVANAGAIGGTVTLAGDAPADSVVTPTAADAPVCGTQVTARRVTRTGDRLAEVVVWLPDVRAGKPLSVERRFELTHDQCELTPRVQAVTAGGTLNLRSVDPILHRARLQRVGKGGRSVTITSTEAGTVVPDDRLLAEPGQVAVQCEVHPWSRAWLLVFDHPYAVVTGSDGAFRLDGVPPGTHKVMAWHPELGVKESSVTVAPGQAATVAVKFGG